MREKGSSPFAYSLIRRGFLFVVCGLALCGVRVGHCELAPALHSEMRLDVTPFVLRVEGRYAVAGTQRGVEVFDVARPSNPARVSTLVLPALCRHLAFAGKYVFAAYAADASNSRIASIDLSIPETPRIVGALALPVSVLDLELGGGILAVACGASGLLLVSASDPENLQVAGEFREAGFSPVSAAFAEGRVFASSHGLHVFDISDRAAPRRVASWANLTPVQTGMVAAEGPIAYLVSPDAGLRVIRWQNAGGTGEAALLSTVTLAELGTAGTEAFSVAVSKGIAYVGLANSFVLIDVRDPSGPRRIWSGAYQTAGLQSVIQEPYAYVLNSSAKKLQVIEIAKESPCDVIFSDRTVINPYPNDAYASVAANFEGVFIGDGRNGIRKVRVNPNGDLEEIGRTTAHGWGLVLEGGRLYHQTLIPNQHKIGVLDPSSLETIGAWYPPLRPDSPFVNTRASIASAGFVGNFAYVKYYSYECGLDTCYFNGVSSVVIDFTTPSMPRVVTEFERNNGNEGEIDPAYLMTVRGNGGYAYVSSVGGIDIFDQRAGIPLKVGRYNGSCRGFAISRGFAFVATGERRIDVLDLTASPTQPTVVASLEVGAATTGIISDSRYACVLTSGLGLEVVDIRDPRAPRWIGTCPEISPRDLVFGSDGDVNLVWGGFHVMRFKDLPYPRLEVLQPGAGVFRFRAMLPGNRASHIQRALNGGEFMDWQPVSAANANQILDFAVPLAAGEFAMFRFGRQ